MLPPALATVRGARFLALEDCDTPGLNVDGDAVQVFDGVVAAEPLLRTASATMFVGWEPEINPGESLEKWEARAAPLRHWFVEFDTSGLVSGKNYKLCTDLDGAGLTQRSGDTDLVSYISPVRELIETSVINGPLGFTYVKFACFGDCTASPSNRSQAGRTEGGEQNTYSTKLVYHSDTWKRASEALFGPGNATLHHHGFWD